MKTEISEKTLELNICEEIIQNIRRQFPKAFWYGPTLREEKHKGFDASLEGASGYALFLQFKRPIKYTGQLPKEYPYWFEVKTAQHETLLELASKYPNSVQYVFPLIGNLTELKNAVPNIRSETNFYILQYSDFLEDPPIRHDVEVYPDKVIFHSQRLERSGYNGKNFGYKLSHIKKVLEPMNFSNFKIVYRQLVLAYLRPYIDLNIITVDEGELLFDYSLPRAVFLPIT